MTPTTDNQPDSGLVTYVEPQIVLGISHPSPAETSETKEVTLQAFPTQGRLYLHGVRAFYDDERAADIVFELQHPKTKKSLLAPHGEVQAIALNPDHEACRYLFSDRLGPHGMAVMIREPHVAGSIEPVYCSRDEPLLVVAKGSAFVHLSIWGSPRYSVVRYPQNPVGCPPENLGEFEGPFPHRSIPGLLPEKVRTPERG
jgi:hypothetical protein